MLKGRYKYLNFKEREKGGREAAKVERKFEKAVANLNKDERNVRGKETGSSKTLLNHQSYHSRTNGKLLAFYTPCGTTT